MASVKTLSAVGRRSRFYANAQYLRGVIATRAELEARFAEIQARYPEGTVPLPDTWGGYRLVPEVIEFWQGRTSRLHDRLRYVRQGDGWIIERLSP